MPSLLDFERHLKAFAGTIEAHLDHLLPATTRAAPRLVEAMRYALLAPGKRIRPFFVAESARLFGVDEARRCRWVRPSNACIAIRSSMTTCRRWMMTTCAAAVPPCIRLSMRRRRYWRATRCSLSLSRSWARRDASRCGVRAELVSELAAAAGKNGMAGGQMLDLEAESEHVADIGRIVTLQAMKTGALFRFACRSGAIMGKAGAARREALTLYADRIGLAFQIADDILDVEASSAASARRPARTRPPARRLSSIFWGLDGAKAEARKLVQRGEGRDAPLRRQMPMSSLPPPTMWWSERNRIRSSADRAA